jgi:hypothetical protein
MVMLMSGLAIAATPGFGDERQQLGNVVIVHRMHGGEVRPGDPAVQA